MEYRCLLGMQDLPRWLIVYLTGEQRNLDDGMSQSACDAVLLDSFFSAIATGETVWRCQSRLEA